MQFGINMHEQIFFEGWSLKKFTSAYLFRIAKKEKSCDYLLIIYMKKYEIAYHNYADAKCAHQVQK